MEENYMYQEARKPLKQQLITYTGCESKEVNGSMKYKIKDEFGKSYTFFAYKKSDGQPTKAFQQFQDLKVGSKVVVNFQESDSVYEGKPITYRTVMFFSPADNIIQPHQQQIPTQPMVPQQPSNNQNDNEVKRMLEDIISNQLSMMETINKMMAPIGQPPVEDINIEDIF